MDEKEKIKFINEELRSALYPTEEDQKHQICRAADNMEIGRLNNEIMYLKAVIEKQNKILGILKNNVVYVPSQIKGVGIYIAIPMFKEDKENKDYFEVKEYLENAK